VKEEQLLTGRYRERMKSLTKDILVQYCDLKEEIKDIRRRIATKEREIAKIEEEGEVVDFVKGGYGGTQRYKISGFPYPEYSRKKTILCLYKAQLENAELDLLTMTNDVEEYIQSLTDSRIRRILRFRFIDGLRWFQVAQRMGGMASEDSVKKEFQRFSASN
jgi:hypothetical protein